MHTHRRSSFSLLPVAILASVLLACSSSKGPSQLQINLVDGPNPEVAQIVVKITKVTAHSASGGWTTIGPDTPITVNLLDLKTTPMALGVVNLPPGKVTQVRLFVSPDDDFVVPIGTTTHQPLVIPSVLRTGIKVLGPWDVPNCSKLSLTLDFDGKSSIEYHEANGTWILRPVIRPKHHEATGISCQPEPPSPPVCSLEAPCPEAETCVSGACVSATPLPNNTSCTEPTQCISGVCNEGVCAIGDGTAGCLSNADCGSQSCVGGSCQSTGTTSIGQACITNDQCVTQNCDGSSCAPGLLGAPCQTGADCGSLNCAGTSCGPPLLPPPPPPGPIPGPLPM